MPRGFFRRGRILLLRNVFTGRVKELRGRKSKRGDSRGCQRNSRGRESLSSLRERETAKKRNDRELSSESSYPKGGNKGTSLEVQKKGGGFFRGGDRGRPRGGSGPVRGKRPPSEEGGDPVWTLIGEGIHHVIGTRWEKKDLRGTRRVCGKAKDVQTD